MENETEGLAARSVAGNVIAVLGFGFLWCAGFLAQSSYGFFGHEAIDAFMGMVSGIALIAASFAMRACRARTALRVVAIGGYFLLVGVMSFGGAAGLPGDCAAVADRVLYALIFFGWIVAFFSQKGSGSGILVPLSFFSGSLMTLACLVFPAVAALFDRKVVLAISLGLLIVWSVLLPGALNDSAPKALKARPSAKMIALRFAPVAFGGLAFSLTFGIMVDLRGWMAAPHAFESVQVINMVVAAALAVSFLVFHGRIRMDAVLTIALPLFAAALLIGRNEADGLSLSRIMMVGGYLFFWVMAWVFTIRENECLDFSAVTVFSFVSGLMLAITQLGRKLAVWALASFGLGSDQLSAVSLVLVWLMVVFSVALYWTSRFRSVDHDLAELEKRGVAKPKQAEGSSSARSEVSANSGGPIEKEQGGSTRAADSRLASSTAASSRVVYVDMAEARYDAFRDRYGLSAREAEILGDFARGRSAASIAEKHVISINTVKTHLRRVYEKTGVHSRQELLDLIDESA